MHLWFRISVRCYEINQRRIYIIDCKMAARLALHRLKSMCPNGSDGNGIVLRYPVARGECSRGSRPIETQYGHLGILQTRKRITNYVHVDLCRSLLGISNIRQESDRSAERVHHFWAGAFPTQPQSFILQFRRYQDSQVVIFDKCRWVEQGGVFVVANIRGGAEYGEAWHMAGQLENKQNVFDDFIAAAEFLKAEGITSEHGLAIQGESNGGLLIGAVTNQRLDLFDAALPSVGVMDMLRFNQFTGGQFWISDYGNSAIEAQFRTLLAYSPYHNVRPGKDYPAILATTADADDRVIPGHSFKYIASIQAADVGPKPHLVRIETRAGHGAGKPQDKVIAEIADMWTFAAHWTGLTIKPQ